MLGYCKKIYEFFFKPISIFGVLYGSKIAIMKLISFYEYRKTKRIGIFNNDFKIIKKIIKSGNLSSSPYPSFLAKKFSDQFLTLNNAKYGVCISNGTEALKVSYRAAGLKYGDEIIIPSLTFHTTASAALDLGIIPKFVDIEEQTLCIDPKEVERQINEKVKAIVIVHLGSMMANIDKILDICKRKNLILIEDCAHAHGSMWKNQGAGTYGDFGCYSFQSSKIISSGEGGFIITKNKKNLDKCISYINCGRNSENYKTLGLNKRLSDIHCALLLTSLKKFKKYRKKRHNNIKYFNNKLSKIHGIKVLQPYKEYSYYSGYAYAFRLDNNILTKIKRERLIVDLKLRGINFSEHLYAPVYITPEFGWKDAPIKISYDNLKSKIAEQVHFSDTVWIAHPFFLLSKNSINHSLKMISDCIKNYL